ncbi:hypothetical protein D3C71_964140 [compost metagenome]
MNSTITDIRQAVASATTNDIFKKIVHAPGKTINKREFLRVLGVDMKTVTPIYFNEQKYIKREHSECIFLFTDKEFKLYGVLEGNKWTDKYSDFEYYTAGAGYNQVIKNFKQMTESAFHILMITPEMRTLVGKIKHSKHQPVKNTERDKKDELENRLHKFRTRKYTKVSHDEVMKKLQYMVSYLSKNMFNQELFQGLREPFRKVDGWGISNMFQAINKLVETSEQYINKYDELQKEMNSESYAWFVENNRPFYPKSDYDRTKIKVLLYWEKLDMENK